MLHAISILSKSIADTEQTASHASVETSVLVFPLCVLFVSCYLFHCHTPFFLLPKMRVVKGVFALIFYSRLGCLTAKLERSRLAPVCP